MMYRKEDIPESLYIPPDALEVYLDQFEGPLDFLLYLIQKDDLNILDIPIVSITEQYLQYIHNMRLFNIELAAEYLLMAAWLAEIKTRFLLPQKKKDPHDPSAEDPRAELVRRLQEYMMLKKAAEECFANPQEGQDFWIAHSEPVAHIKAPEPPLFSVHRLTLCLQDLLKRASFKERHRISKEPLSVRERMTAILQGLLMIPIMSFKALFVPEEGRSGVVVAFLAVLELLKSGLIDILPAAEASEADQTCEQSPKPLFHIQKSMEDPHA